MLQLAGLLLVLILVAGALASTGGASVLAALPFELSLIGGAALGTLLIANSARVSAEALLGFWRALHGPRWRREAYEDLIGLLRALLGEVRRGGFVAIEADMEVPADSPRFANAPMTLKDASVCTYLTEALQALAIDPSAGARLDEALAGSAAQAREEQMKAVRALIQLADALPALGIVAAVLGIIKTMAAIDQPTDILGGLIAGALLGTFLGVFLSYGVVGPLAARFGDVVEADTAPLEVIRATLSAHCQGAPPHAAVEAGRRAIPQAYRPAAIPARVVPLAASRRPRRRAG